MSPLEAVVLGAVQGVTEFLPISSTAHLKIVPVLLGWAEPGAAFSAVTQWGTLLSAVVYFWRDVCRLAVGFVRGLLTFRPLTDPDSRLAWMIIAGTVPVVVCGLVFKDAIETWLRSLYVIAAAAIGLAIVLACAEGMAALRRREGINGKELEQVRWADALFVGLAQAVALIPGASRSGVTITGALLAGLSRPTAARFSFLLSLPAVFAAGLYSLVKERNALLGRPEDALALVIATAVSAVIGYASIAILLRYLRTHTTWVFIIYRVGLGLLLLILLKEGVLKDDKPAPHRGGEPADVTPARPSR